MNLIILVIFAFHLHGAQNIQKVNIYLIERLAEIELVYKACLSAGMSVEEASKAACDWQDSRYPVVLDQIKKPTGEHKSKKLVSKRS